MRNQAFAEANDVEARGMLVLTPFLKWCSHNAEPYFTNESSYLQKYMGDVILDNRRGPHAGKIAFVEIKIEEKDTGNLFLETWSNRSRLVDGWLRTSRCGLLWYYFLDTNRLYSLGMGALKDWAFGAGETQGGIYATPERMQGKRNQLNDTWGRPVRIDILRRALVDAFEGPIDPTARESRLQKQFSLF